MTVKKKKIAIIIQLLTGGGAERAAANLSFDLSEEAEIHLIVFDGKNKSYQYEGQLHDLSLPATNNKLYKFFTVLKRIIMVRKIKKSEKFDISISFLEGANLVNVLSRYKEKIIISERNMTSIFVKGMLHRLLEKYLIKKSERVVALSKVVQEDLLENFVNDRNKIVTIYNSVNPEKLSTYDQYISQSNSDPVFVTMGRLTDQKAQWRILRAMTIVKGYYPKAKLKILGEGELKESFEKLVQNLNIEDNVEFLGYQSNPHDVLYQSDIFVFSSKYEGLANVLLEALACGLPIISTDCDAGPREILSPRSNPRDKTSVIEYCDYGILVTNNVTEQFDNNYFEPNEVEIQLAKSMIDLYENKELRKEYKEKSVFRIKDFSPEEIKKDWLYLINQI